MSQVRLGKFWSIWISLSLILVVAIYLKPVEEKMANKEMEATVVKSDDVKSLSWYTAPKLDFLLEYNHLKELLNQ